MTCAPILMCQTMMRDPIEERFLTFQRSIRPGKVQTHPDLSLVPLQLPLSPMMLFGVGVELPDLVPADG